MISVLAVGFATESAGKRRAVRHADVQPDECPAIGTAKSAVNQALNVLKNRDQAPLDAQVDTTVTLAGMLADGDDHDRFDPQKGAEITGFVTDVKQGGHPETANCGNVSVPLTDTHITVAMNPNDPNTQSVVVEVTPRMRAAMALQGIDWSTPTLASQLVGHRVTFRGWLLFDRDHVGQAVNTAPNNNADWRKTVWEIHPITALTILQ